MKPSAARQALHLLLGAIALGLLTIVLRQFRVTNATTVALLFLIVVLSIATASSLPVVVLCSAFAALALNYFFMAPVGTLSIADPQNWVALIVFLIVGFVAWELSSSAQARAREAQSERRAAEDVRQKVELASTILASLAHDLRTPLTAIGVAVGNLLNPALADVERQQQGRLALAELDRLKRLFRDILEMARIDAAALTIERDWVTPADIVDAALASLRPALDDRAVRVTADTDAVVQVDPRLTSAALSHLIENAIQYSPPDQPIELAGTVTSDGLELAVRDHGDGLDDDEVGQVFERFFRGRRAKQKTHGAGIGLAITQGLLSVQGGRATARNESGGGATFTIRIPSPSHAIEPEQT
jgi:two-component system sensor histidine kinase KdpD